MTVHSFAEGISVGVSFASTMEFGVFIAMAVILIAGIFAGWLMGLLAWLVTAAQETISRIFIIWIITATIGILHLPHSIAGNVEVLFGLLISTEIGFIDYVQFLTMATIGNVLGGAIFVGLLKYSHVIRGAE